MYCLSIICLIVCLFVYVYLFRMYFVHEIAEEPHGSSQRINYIIIIYLDDNKYKPGFTIQFYILALDQDT